MSSNNLVVNRRTPCHGHDTASRLGINGTSTGHTICTDKKTNQNPFGTKHQSVQQLQVTQPQRDLPLENYPNDSARYKALKNVMLKALRHLLFRLLQVARCLERRGDAIAIKTSVTNCNHQRCRLLKDLLNHMLQCKSGNKCTVIYCYSVTQLVKHWKNCKKIYCEICSPLKRVRPHIHKLTPLKQVSTSPVVKQLYYVMDSFLQSNPVTTEPIYSNSNQSHLVQTSRGFGKNPTLPDLFNRIPTVPANQNCSINSICQSNPPVPTGQRYSTQMYPVSTGESYSGEPYQFHIPRGAVNNPMRPDQCNQFSTTPGTQSHSINSVLQYTPDSTGQSYSTQPNQVQLPPGVENNSMFPFQFNHIPTPMSGWGGPMDFMHYFQATQNIPSLANWDYEREISYLQSNYVSTSVASENYPNRSIQSDQIRTALAGQDYPLAQSIQSNPFTNFGVNSTCFKQSNPVPNPPNTMKTVQTPQAETPVVDQNYANNSNQSNQTQSAMGREYKEINFSQTNQTPSTLLDSKDDSLNCIQSSEAQSTLDSKDYDNNSLQCHKNEDNSSSCTGSTEVLSILGGDDYGIDAIESDEILSILGGFGKDSGIDSPQSESDEVLSALSFEESSINNYSEPTQIPTTSLLDENWGMDDAIEFNQTSRLVDDPWCQSKIRNLIARKYEFHLIEGCQVEDVKLNGDIIRRKSVQDNVGGITSDRGCSINPQLPNLKILLDHASHCQDDFMCTELFCGLTRKLLLHGSKCTRSDCSLCFLLKQAEFKEVCSITSKEDLNPQLDQCKQPPLEQTEKSGVPLIFDNGQRSLAMCLHAETCQSMGITEKEEEPSPNDCAHPFCPRIKGLLKHMQNCKAEKNCTKLHCWSCVRALAHFRNCTRSDCHFCLPFKTPIWFAVIPIHEGSWWSTAVQ